MVFVAFQQIKVNIVVKIAWLFNYIVTLYLGIFIASSCYAHARKYMAHYNATETTDAGLLDGECVSNNRQHESNYTTCST